MNRNYGHTDGTRITEYAPSYFDTENGVILNPTRARYLDLGWYRIVLVKPDPPNGKVASGHRFEVDREKGEIVQVWTYADIAPTVKPPAEYSKVELEMALFQLGLLDKFDEFIDSQFIENGKGQKLPLRRVYDTALVFRDDNEYFEKYLEAAVSHLGITMDMAKDLLTKVEAR